VAWLPDRVVTLHRDQPAWHRERLRALGDSERHRAFWALLDRLADVFWAASRAGVRMPVRRPADALHNVRAVGWRHLPMARHLARSLGDALRRFGLRDDAALVGLLGMLTEDTVHSSVDRAPLINAALGVTIRGAGLTRHRGGMHGFWRCIVAHYRRLGGDLRTGCRVDLVAGRAGAYRVHTTRGSIDAGVVVSGLPAASTARIAPSMARRLRPYLQRDEPDLGGAIVMLLGVPQDEVTGQPFTHHQLMQDYARPLGEGNNMFVSVSAPGDTDSAPPGHRAVMISTHTELSTWDGLPEPEYQRRKREIGDRLVAYARRAYPRLADRAVVRQVGTPRTYERFAFRPRGAVGGARQTLRNTNQRALPHDLGGPGFWLVGDSTWPGLGTVACVLGSRIVHDGIRRAARRRTVGVGR
jgi:phytoene dehydrogenase-like protein